MTQTLKFRTANKLGTDYIWQTATITEDELWIDIIKEHRVYVVETREDALRRSHNHIADFYKRRAAVAFAQDYAAWLQGERDRPKCFEDKYIDLDC